MEPRVDFTPFLGVDKLYFDSPSQRLIQDEDFVDLAKSILDRRCSRAGHPLRFRDWKLVRSDIWMHCRPATLVLPAQGWKIHVSSVEDTARIVLSIVIALLVERGVAFKFAADLPFLRAINGKRCSRSSSGKFITIYPRDIHEFRSVMEDLHSSLSGYEGPCILTDRRYLDSSVLHYRYGGIVSDSRIRTDGRREWLITAPDGSKLVDTRQPLYWLPNWLKDPFGNEPAGGSTSNVVIGGGRFRVHKALAFSAAGGVYLADDLHDGRRVVVKEARPNVGEGVGATATLRKEFRLLQRLSELDVTPRPFAHFRDWEHTFLVEEYLEGNTLRAWLGRRYPWVKCRATRGDVTSYLKDICKVFTHLADAMERVHAENISIGDLSSDNCIVDADGRVRFIDLEAAIEHGMDAPIDLRTPGFTSLCPDRSELSLAIEEDYYAFGANLFAAVMPVNTMLTLDRGAASRFVASMVRSMGYPPILIDLVEQLTCCDPASRPRPQWVMARLREVVATMDEGTLPVPHRVVEHPTVCEPVAELVRFIDARASQSRPDRFVPADVGVFETHPWGIAHGAAGIAHAYRTITGKVHPETRRYLLEGTVKAGGRGASFMTGDTGIAWVLFDMGEDDRAGTLMRNLSGMTPAAWVEPGLYQGMAGWGLGCIKAWHATSNTGFLTDAKDVGEALLRAAGRHEQGMHWSMNGRQPVGLAQGASGIALFLMHLHVATGERAFIEAAQSALEFDFAQRRPNPDGDPSWPSSLEYGIPSPYLAQGTAGVVAVAARMYAVTGDRRYQDMVLTGEADLFRPYAMHPSLFEGLAGIGETLLDLATFLPDRADIYLREARKVATGIEPFLIRRPDGLAIPGSRLLRLSCDLATGSAGVAMFFHRLRRGGFASFMLDEHLPSMADAQKAVSA
ncbi:MAG: Serine/threonine-protein kinase C [Luteibacter sp.]|uniref:class III lanthionine synthetase LanKC n=1 Tax=Luteibacter sp. TaxID=1886636 RepID=UPI001384219C|nr:class III lanthionine synthetase LanKC [Luteibacter sp.]KAF1006307.1 MAG: Serine/threonine-protein kinase C [Luteibacter sp.]